MQTQLTCELMTCELPSSFRASMRKLLLHSSRMTSARRFPQQPSTYMTTTPRMIRLPAHGRPVPSFGWRPCKARVMFIRRMFSDVDADVHVLVDGDNTYEAAAAPKMIEILVQQSLDVVTGRRLATEGPAYRAGHRVSNYLLTGAVATIFGSRTSDMLSGYRVFSRRFVKSFPALSRGFEIETELTVHALELRMPMAAFDTRYVARLPGSKSKLSTFRDGLRILAAIAWPVKEERPMQFFGLAAIASALLSLVLMYPVFLEYLRTGLVPRYPTAILSAAIMIAALLCFFTGLILDSVTHARREMKRVAYLSQDNVSVAIAKRNGDSGAEGARKVT
jgi:hypothetical protein